MKGFDHMSRYAWIGLLLMTMGAVAQANTYYVATDGSDSANGLPEANAARSRFITPLNFLTSFLNESLLVEMSALLSFSLLSCAID